MKKEIKSRIIKFRAWDTIQREIVEYDRLISLQVHQLFGGGVLEVMQFTGLNAKNGKEIYEGDVVIWNDSGGETKLNPKKGWIRKAVVKIDPSLNFELTKDTPSGSPEYKFHFGNFIYADTEKHLKILGNIFQNPELLSK